MASQNCPLAWDKKKRKKRKKKKEGHTLAQMVEQATQKALLSGEKAPGYSDAELCSKDSDGVEDEPKLRWSTKLAFAVGGWLITFQSRPRTYNGTHSVLPPHSQWRHFFHAVPTRKCAFPARPQMDVRSPSIIASARG
jgi:hypothetical protein